MSRLATEVLCGLRLAEGEFFFDHDVQFSEVDEGSAISCNLAPFESSMKDFPKTPWADAAFSSAPTDETRVPPFRSTLNDFDWVSPPNVSNTRSRSCSFSLKSSFV